MYGLVNKAIQGLVVQNHGQETWDQIREAAGLGETSFVGLQSYPDEDTYNLVGAASRILNVPPDQLLVAFGRYWIQFIGASAFSEFLDAEGFEECLSSLDEMHARISITFPELQPPSFEMERLGEGHLKLSYFSDRPGLAPMVRGLLEGLAEHFNEPYVQIEHRPGEGCEEFELRIQAAQEPYRDVG